MSRDWRRVDRDSKAVFVFAYRSTPLFPPLARGDERRVPLHENEKCSKIARMAKAIETDETSDAASQGVHILAEGGRIADRLAGYEVRPQQLEMARAVAAAFESGEHLIVEAGTGVGKSFAYLVPAIQQVVHHGGRVVISTHTIALQEQLIDKDIPFLRSVFSEPFSAVLVKGRSNYLGLRRLTRASSRQELLFDAKGDVSELHAIEDWAYETTDGSLADLSDQPSMKVWERVKSDSDDCLGRNCAQFNKCFYQRARRRANEAQLLIVNHALLFSDLAVRQQGASILPDYDYVILDEAHTVEGVAGDHLGLGVSNAQVRHLLNTLHNERSGRGILTSGGGRSMMAKVAEAHRAVDDYFGDLAQWRNERGGDWNGRLREPPPFEQPLSARLLELQDGLRSLRKESKDEDERSELGGLAERCVAMATSFDNWHQQKTPGWVYWMESGGPQRQRARLCARPLDVGRVLRETLFDKTKSVVLTSATLVTDTKSPFRYLRKRLCLEDVKGLVLGSPFDFRQQLKVYIEAKMPDPSDSTAFVPAACSAIRKYVRMTKGRAFVLFTSYKMLRECAELLGEFFAEQKMPLLVHGSGLARSQMLESFRATPRSVLFGTDTFWAGVDVPGDALSNVIIVKLPFSVPNHPVVQARIERIREEGGNPFIDFQLPEAVLKLKQGVGRLIRTRRDRGIVVILDPRVKSKPYGSRFLRALPECEVIVAD